MISAKCIKDGFGLAEINTANWRIEQIHDQVYLTIYAANESRAYIMTIDEAKNLATHLSACATQ